jgi:branched-chain amino acid transport system ATP-binding protein
MISSEIRTPLLRISALTKRFGGFTALDNVSVEIPPRERFGLIGPNGSGKTTLINCNPARSVPSPAL